MPAGGCTSMIAVPIVTKAVHLHRLRLVAMIRRPRHPVERGFARQLVIVFRAVVTCLLKFDRAV